MYSQVIMADRRMCMLCRAIERRQMHRTRTAYILPLSTVLTQTPLLLQLASISGTD